MKKSVMFLGLLMVAGVSFAGQNWSTSTGGSWNTPDDTSVTPNQFLVIGSTSNVQPNVKAVTNPAITATTLATVKNSTPSAAGQLYYCSDCVGSPLCISTSTVGSINGNSNSIVMVSSSPVGAASTFTACK